MADVKKPMAMESGIIMLKNHLAIETQAICEGVKNHYLTGYF